jgi:hypothetical protein
VFGHVARLKLFLLLLCNCCCIVACRAADTYPNQMLEITVRMYLYRWRHGTDGQGPVYSQHLLDVSCLVGC